jgi:WD40 repeat protein
MFVHHFGTAMAKSAPHVYLSALPFAPKNSPVSVNYSSSFPHILCVEQGQISHWPSLQMMIPNVGYTVKSVAISPDGQRIVSGCFDKTVCVWDTATGEVVAGPFIKHTESVNSVQFSPDGQQIVSGSDDKTIYVWNTKTGEPVAGPFIGHKDRVLSVGFSPDGQQIVSGSTNGTICVWNTMTGKAVAGPFIGHKGWVTSLEFSPDG